MVKEEQYKIDITREERREIEKHFEDTGRITYEEAAKVIGDYDALECGFCHQGGYEIEEAFRMGIKALKQIETIESIIDSSMYIQEDVLRYKMICKAMGRETV